MKSAYSIAGLLAVLFATNTNGQTLEKMKELFPDKLAIFSNITRNVEISYKKGIPYAEASELSEMMILDDNANGMFNKDHVYHSNFNELKKIEAYTLVPEGSSSKKIKVTEFKTQSSKSQGVFYDDVKETSFDYPQLRKGSISHVETQHFNKDIRFLSTFYFSNYLPVHNASYSVTYPSDIDIRYIVKNDVNKTLSVQESTEGKKKKLTFTATNVKNFDYFGDGTSFPYYGLHVIVYVASYRNNNETVPVFSSTDALHKWNVNFLNDINSSVDPHLKKITDSICNGKKTDAEKAQAIFLWVQHHIKYVAFEEGLEGFIPRQAADVCAKRYGDCKDMASILTSMLRISGMDAYFTWIGTRDIPYSYHEVPLPLSDNHMICAVMIDKKWVFLDATDPNCIFGYPTSGIQDKEALISMSKDKFEIVKVPTVSADKNTIVDSTFLTISDKTLLGRSSVNYNGYFGSDVYTSLLYHKGEDERIYAKRRLGKGSNKFTLKDYRISLTDTTTRSANISGNFEIPDYVKQIGDEIYINMNVEKLMGLVYIDTVKRKMAVENDFLYTINQVHVLAIPAGYTVDYIPKNKVVSNDVVLLSIEYSKTADAIIATQQYIIKGLYITPQQFSDWNKAVAAVSPEYKEQVVLKKK